MVGSILPALPEDSGLAPLTPALGDPIPSLAFVGAHIHISKKNQNKFKR